MPRSSSSATWAGSVRGTERSGSIAAFFAGCGARCGVGAPITVEGGLWGVLAIVSTDPERLPAGSELATAQFTDLLATAVANAEAR